MSSKIHQRDVKYMNEPLYRSKKNVISMQLRLMRTRRRLTQTDLAARMQVLGVSIDQQSISKIENNKRTVTDFELAGFCKALNCTEKDLLQDFYEQLKD